MINRPPLYTYCPAASPSAASQASPGPSSLLPDLTSSYLDDVGRRHAETKRRGYAPSSRGYAPSSLVQDLLAQLLTLPVDSAAEVSARDVAALRPILTQLAGPLEAQGAALWGQLLEAQGELMRRGRMQWEAGKGQAAQAGEGEAGPAMDPIQDAQELARIVKCLQGYSEEDFEDGLAWAKCAFICR